jgi:type I restriction enzyme M protein
MLGAIIGDIVGGGFALHPTHSYRITLENGTFVFTENTVLMTAVCDLLYYCREPAKGRIERMIRSREITDMLKKYARAYPEKLPPAMRKWSARRLREHSLAQADFSPIFALGCAYAFGNLDDVLSQTELFCSDICDTESARQCARAVNSAVYALKNGAEKEALPDYVVSIELNLDFQEVSEELAFGRTPEAAVRAGFEAFLRSSDYDSALRYAVAYGAMSPTVAAVSGALAGEYYGVPDELKELTYDTLGVLLRNPLDRFMELHKDKR